VRTIIRSAALAAAVLLAFGMAAASAAGLPIAKKTIGFKAKQIEVSVDYPVTGNKAIDAVLLAYAGKQVADFKREATASGPPMADMGYYLQVGYDVERNDGKMLGIVFSEESFMGGAHPNHDSTAFNFTLPDGAQVFIGEILDGHKGIARLSAIATAQLIKEITTGAEPASDADSVRNGAGPLADNFKVFVWLPNKVHLYFPPYQVASYAAGPQETTVDLKLLKDVIRPDWRAPAPSFDCAKAKSVIEKTICADAALARLDRQVGEAYDLAMHNVAYDPNEQKKVLDAQRAFIATAARTCNNAASNPCLTKAYRARLVALTAPPQ
jgi:uncharacterized protein YecT (DUF1311 family)